MTVNSFTRGIKNTFRNNIRTLSVVTILSLSIGLALIMLLSMFAVEDRIASVRTSVGNTIAVSPAGIRGFQGDGELLTVTDAEAVAGLDHVVNVEQVYMTKMAGGDDTSLSSAIDAGSFGASNSSSSQTPEGAPGGAGAGREPPLMLYGVSNATSAQSLGVDQLVFIDGEAFSQGEAGNYAVVGVDLAEENGLETGSSFSAFDNELTVTGIYDADNQYVNSSMVLPIDTAREITGYEDEVFSMFVTVDSSENIDSVDAAVAAELGDKADVVSQLDQSADALSSLEGIEAVASYSLAGALVSAAAILFLIMLMIVRERRQEIGVLKAIGASNFKVVKQFIFEALTFTLIAGLLGIGVGIIFSNPVLEVLVNSNTTTTVADAAVGIGSERGPGAVMRGAAATSDQSALENITAVVNYELIVYGLGAAIAIAIIGSAVPSWLIAKVRPAEAMRGE